MIKKWQKIDQEMAKKLPKIDEELTKLTKGRLGQQCFSTLTFPPPLFWQVINSPLSSRKTPSAQSPVPCPCGIWRVMNVINAWSMIMYVDEDDQSVLRCHRIFSCTHQENECWWWWWWWRPTLCDWFNIQSEPTSFISSHTSWTSEGGGGSFCLGAPHSMLTKALCEERGGWRVMLYSASMYVGHTCYLCVWV